MRCALSTTLVLAAAWFAAPAHAFTHFIASNGTDSTNCTRTAPCETINQALNNAAVNDTIVCVDTVVTGYIPIFKSIDIDCSGARLVVRDSINTSFNAAIYINIPVSAGDTFRTVRLRGISVNGSNGGNTRFIPIGVRIVSAAAVYIENVVVSDMIQQGILDERTGGQTTLFITDSIIRNNGGTGVAIGSQGPSTIVLDNVSSENNAYGIGVASGNQIMINRSVFSGNSAAGVEGDTGAQIVVNNSSISHNNIGVQGNQSVRLSNNDIAFNNTALSGASGTFGNNRFSGNATMGTNPTPLGGASPDLGQQ